LNDTHTFAHTSPVYVQAGKQRVAHRADVRFYIDWIERLIARTQERGRFATAAHRKEVLEVFERALAVYRGLL
jgi:desulfoferrodoxin (superoxide reductase-like protein)